MAVLVIGARGHVGRGVLDGLLASGASVRASARDPSALALPDTVPAALDGVGAVFCNAARTAGVDRVVLLSSFVCGGG